MFLAALFLTFPRREALNFLIDRAGKTGKMEISCPGVKPTLLGAKADKIAFTDQKKQTFTLEKVDLIYGLVGIWARAEAGKGKLRLSANPLGADFRLEKFPAPPQLSSLLGSAELDIRGDYSFWRKAGKADFTILSRQLPPPFTGSEVTITGQAVIQKTQIAIDFKLNSAQIKGEGNLKIDQTSPRMPVDGKIEINLGNATLNYLLKGDLEKLEVLPEISGGGTGAPSQGRGFNR